ncbi:hypothetical protein [Pontiella sp.]|uniref:hypothetical protein n=1 Tax=Pontiella sp. TaxID=2837462 RepID=UPI003568A71A
MNLYVRLATAIGSMAAYLAALRFVAPPDQPYFIMGIGVVGLVAWLLGSLQGLIAALLLVPLTNLIYEQFSLATSYDHFAGSPAYVGMQIIIALAIGHLRRKKKAIRQKELEMEETNHQLQAVLSQVKELGGIHNLCSSCKMIQDDQGSWQSIDRFLTQHTKMEFSHCICPDCAETFKPPPDMP